MEAITASVPLRIAIVSGGDNVAYFIKPSSATASAPPYIMINPGVTFSSITFDGQVAAIDHLRILAHEIGHWGNDTHDPIGVPARTISDSDLNNPSFDAVGSSVRYEREVSNQIDDSPTRSTYFSTVLSSDAASMEVVYSQSSWTFGHTVTTVRVGGPGTTPTLGPDDVGYASPADNYISFQGWSATSALALGVAGNDIILQRRA